MTEFTPGRCEWAITAQDDAKGIRLPSGFHIEGEKRCPRNLPLELAEVTQPNGKEDCLLHDPTACHRAFFEEKSCPVRRQARQRAMNKKI